MADYTALPITISAWYFNELTFEDELWADWLMDAKEQGKLIKDSTGKWHTVNADGTNHVVNFSYIVKAPAASGGGLISIPEHIFESLYSLSGSAH